MKPIKLTIKIEAVEETKIGCRILSATEENRLDYHTSNGAITPDIENELAAIIRHNQHQFQKVMRSAVKGRIKAGKTIQCVFIEDFNFLKESDFNNFIRVDRRHGRLDITTSDSETSPIHKIYADGSYECDTRHSGFGGFTEDPQGQQEIFFQSLEDGSSNLMELLAVTEGLQRLQPIQRIQVNTDSRFVIRGLVQWSHFWTHNNWQTAYGRKVRYAKYWQQAHQLCEDKFVEFKWIKGHSGDVKQDFCHQLAKESTSR